MIVELAIAAMIPASRLMQQIGSISAQLQIDCEPSDR